tara:strand:+ start:30 stop:464 length:435 start_codon:yes stop_codon:yes gene_type:complete
MGFDNAEILFLLVEIMFVPVAFFFAFVWCGMFAVGYLFADKVKPVSFKSNLNIGEVDDQDLFAVATGNEEYLAAHCTLKPLPPLPKKKKSKPPKIDNPLIKDCVETLVGLGEKKSIARATVNKYFVDNPNTKTVDQFIQGVFKR